MRAAKPVSGSIKCAPEDFFVRERLSFSPSAEGSHLYLWVEKKSLSAFELVERIANCLDISRDDIGTAGLKDTHATTQQWVSVPRTQAIVDKVQNEQLWDDALRILDAVAHPHKLRTGLLRGNDFTIRLTKLCGEDVRASITRRWEAVGELGLLNAFGAQRFGRQQNTLELGLLLLREPTRKIKKPLRRLALSAVQSALFNQWLEKRLEDGLVHEVLSGDVMQVVASGGPFWADDIAEVTNRLKEKKVVVTGPIFGPKMRKARDQACEREQQILSDAKLGIDDFAQHKKLCLGTRRPAVVFPELKTLHFEDETTCVLSFFLPAGSYATELVGALLDDTTIGP